MKKSAFIAASVAGASAAVSASPSSSTFVCNPKVQFPRQEGKVEENSSSSADKFAPKFDGLRFIETLVTAHR
ncbi:uncharacterized protein LOC111011258 [Momordica charantia]|uniref:Uncharacterized protein LOC111011258 n=1 Tax=Momordica charantia TaxID=3673 RepID=A0A6J1CHM8_MOMCH|nr:uncharacterized protein LOC111011258 [Momordica charantia]